MKRDMELFRALLFEVEKVTNGVDWFKVEVEGYTSTEVFYHAELARDAGFIDAQFSVHRFTDAAITVVKVQRLTYAGHEFLDAARGYHLGES